MVIIKTQRPATEMLIAFITQYRLMETAPLETGFAVILNSIFEGQPDATGLIGLCHKWKYNKQFGQFFTKHLRKPEMIRILNHWGIVDEEDEKYLNGCDLSYNYHTQHQAPDTVAHIFRMVLFFESRAISAEVISGTTLTRLPESKNDRYGCSANWGKYILDLPSPEKFFTKLFEHFNR